MLLELQEQKLLRATYSEKQLQEVLTDFWFNHFNVDARKGRDRYLLTEYERDAIRPNVLGKFRDLLGATAKSPAMLFYLDNFQSVDPNAQMMGRGQRPAFGIGRGRGRGLVMPIPMRQTLANQIVSVELRRAGGLLGLGSWELGVGVSTRSTHRRLRHPCRRRPLPARA